MADSYNPQEKTGRPPIVPGMLLILVGVWLLVRQLELPLFVGDVVWPWLIIVLGVIIWARYLVFPPRSADDVWWGTAALLAGTFLLSWRNGHFLPEAQGWGTLWPVIPLIIGASSLVQWVFSIRNWGALVFGAAFAASGAVGLAYTTGQISSATAWAMAQYWPLLIVLVGIGLLIQGLLGPRTR